jgi:3-deoxy-7-phosphoheptulonate synthase
MWGETAIFPGKIGLFIGPSRKAPTVSTWTPDSWQRFISLQQPDWPDRDHLAEVEKKLEVKAPLIFAGEARSLMESLGEAARGEAFVIQAGDCAETFQEFSPDRVKNLLKVILQMAVVLTWSSGVPTVKIGRIAGQFAKPRSSATETVTGVELASYRGDIINSADPSPEARKPDPENLLRAYDQSASTMNLLRAFASGGFADLAAVHQWNREFVASSSEGQRYESIASGIDAALRFMRACRIDARQLHEVELYSSHEALLLPYEQALTRQDSTANDSWYDCSAHMLWIGNRTKQLDQAHIEFIRGVGNPLGCKIDSHTTLEHALGLCERLNPDNVDGRLTFISRMGKDDVGKHLPTLIEGIRDAGHSVLWICDPMHGNIIRSEGGLKTRRMEDILSELAAYFEVHKQLGTWPGGIMLELTGENVTECLGGPDSIVDDELPMRYLTACDPRLNARQSLDLAYSIAELLETSL